MKNKLGIAGQFAKFFVENQKIGFLVTLILFISGVFFFSITPKQYNPEITAPAFNVITDFPGASSFEVEEFVTKPLEDLIMDIKGVDEVLSQSVDGGRSIVTVKFFVGEEVEASKIKIIQEIDGNLDLKPFGALDPIIKELNPDDVPVMTLALVSKDLNLINLRSSALALSDHLKVVEDATNIEVVGGWIPEHRISLDPLLLLERNVTVMDVITSVQSSNQRFVIDTLSSGDKGETLVLDGVLGDLSALQNLPIAYRNGILVFLKDIATVTQEPQEVRSFVRFRKNNEEAIENAVFISISKKKGSNSATVTKQILSEAEEYMDQLKPALFTLEVVRDEGKIASEEINGLTVNLITSIAIVFLVLLFSLGSRASFVVAISIPLTLFTVFSIAYLAGQSINRITLFALILSLGLLVDNATVVVENIISHVKKRQGEAQFTTLVVEAVDEVGMGLIMSTLTTLLAFFPMAFVTGMMGPYMGPIPFFVPAALIVSLILSFTINPFLSVKFLNLPSKENHPISQLFKLFKSSLKKSMLMKKWKKLEIEVNKRLEWARSIPEIYKIQLHQLLESRALQKKVLGSTTVLLLISLLLPVLGVVKFRMLPKADRNQFNVYLDLPEGYQVEKTDEVVQEVEAFFLEDERVVSIQSFVGEAPILDFNGLFKGAESRVNENQATLIVNLQHTDERSIKSEEFVLHMRQELEEKMKSYPDLDIQFVEDPPGPPVMSTFLLKVQGENDSELSEIALELSHRFSGISELKDINTSNGVSPFELSYKVNNEKMAYYNVSYSDLLNTLQAGYASVVVGSIHEQTLEQHLLRVQFNENVQESEQDLSSIFIRNNAGLMVPLSELVSVQYETGEQVIRHDERRPTSYVMGEMGDRSVTYATLEAFYVLLNYELPSGQGRVTNLTPFGLDMIDDSDGSQYQFRFGGEWELTVEVFRDLGAAMLVAVFLIYFVLVAQFHSFRIPVLVMITIPFSLIGVLPGFALLGWIQGLYFNATSMIGVIALAGIVVNNAIILVETIQQKTHSGLDLKHALVESALSRMRPIALTSATTILGSLTIISDPVWAGLAWAIIFGLSISTGLTLILFPTLYYLSEGTGFKVFFSKTPHHE